MSSDQIAKVEDKQSSEALERLRENLARKAAVDADAAEYEWSQIQASKDNARVYSFIGPVGVATAQLCMDTIGQWAREDGEKPIRIVFNSPGGSVMDGLALFDYIQELRAAYGIEFTTVALGTCASMASVLLQAGDKRVMAKHGYIMVHEIQTEAIGSMSDIDDSAGFARRLQNQILDILAERSSMPREDIKTKWERREWWLDAEEALELGFCDEIQ